MTDEKAVLEELMAQLGEASGRIRAFRHLLLEHQVMDEMQAAIDERREARERSGGAHTAAAREERLRPKDPAGAPREAT